MARLCRSDSHTGGTKLGRVAASALGATVLLGALVFGLSTTIPDAIAAKPAPPPPAPAVYYDVNILGEGSPIGMNQAGVMVGRSKINGHAFRYDLITGAVDLNIGASLIDLDSPSPFAVPIEDTGWVAVKATGINNFGEIVGFAQNGVATRAFYFDPVTSLFKLLPGPAFDCSCNVLDINDGGTICASSGNANVIVYNPNLTTYAWLEIQLPIVPVGVDINNSGVIVTTTGGLDPTSVRIVPNVDYTSPVITQFPHCSFTGISDTWICGIRAPVGSVKGGPIRLPVLGSLSQVQLIYAVNTMSNWPGGVNNDGDVVINASRTLYKDGALLKIDDLIAPEDRTLWNAYSKYPRGISERYAIDATDPNNPAKRFGFIGFEATSDGGNMSTAILLTPRKP